VRSMPLAVPSGHESTELRPTLKSRWRSLKISPSYILPGTVSRTMAVSFSFRTILGTPGPRENVGAALDQIAAHSISNVELTGLLENVQGQVVLIIDACNSGQALESSEWRQGPFNNKNLAQLAYDKGMYVLAASQSYQLAMEGAQFGHGFLTYALIEEGLKQGKAGQDPRDGEVDVREWFEYAANSVPELKSEVVARDLRRDREDRDT